MILNADCFDALPSIEPGSVDMVFCDLPYGTTRNDWDSLVPLDRLWPLLRRVAKPSAAMVFTAQTPFDKLLGVSNLRELRYEWVWEKTNATGHLNAKRAPMKAHENVLVFYRRQPTYNPQITHGHVRKAANRGAGTSTNYGAHGPSGYDSTSRYPRSVLTFRSDKQRSRLHPTQKPVALMEYLIRTYTNPGELVLDPTAGAMTTAVAARNLGRDFICIEKDPDYFQRGIERLGIEEAA